MEAYGAPVKTLFGEVPRSAALVIRSAASNGSAVIDVIISAIAATLSRRVLIGDMLLIEFGSAWVATPAS